MSIIVEQNEEIEDSTLVEQELAEAAAEATPETTPEYELPDKFKEKTAEDIAKSYTELEKEFGRKNNEVGELRKLTNQLLEQELSKKEEKPAEKVDFDSLVDDPEKAINEAVANNPVLKELQENLKKSQRDTAQTAFETKHPDYMDVANSDEFKTFVQSNPLMLESYERAVNYDYKAADSLLTLYKQMNSVAAEQANETKQSNKKKVLNDAAVEKSSSGTVSKKMYRSTDLIRMRNEDPDRFLSMGDEIRAAYAEGRVK
jgi:hypothetical protein